MPDNDDNIVDLDDYFNPGTDSGNPPATGSNTKGSSNTAASSGFSDDHDDDGQDTPPPNKAEPQGSGFSGMPGFPSGPAPTSSNESSDDSPKATTPTETPVDSSTRDKPEVVEVTEVKDVPTNNAVADEKPLSPDDDEFKENIWEVLEQAGVTKGKIIVVLVVIVVLVFILFKFVLGGGDSDSADQPRASSDDQPPVEVVTSDDSAQQVDLPDMDSSVYPLVTAYIIGLEYNGQFNQIEAYPIGTWGDNSAIDIALAIGSSPESFDDNKYRRYLSLLQEMQNIYATDVYALLDASRDRRDALDQYMHQMEEIINKGDENLADIELVLSNLKTTFDELSLERDDLENQYFQASDNLLVSDSYQLLQNFIEIEQSVVEVKAYFSAYSNMKDMYNNSLAALKPRFDDVVLNQDALLTGVRVFDVPFSDIESIIRLSN